MLLMSVLVTDYDGSNKETSVFFNRESLIFFLTCYASELPPNRFPTDIRIQKAEWEVEVKKRLAQHQLLCDFTKEEKKSRYRNAARERRRVMELKMAAENGGKWS